MALSGAQNATTLLGVSLAGVALWSDTLAPLVHTAWTGEPLQLKLAGGDVLAVVLFVAGFVFISNLSDDFAQVALWFVLALWAVYLVMHPDVITAVSARLTPGTAADNGGAAGGAF